MKKRRCEPEIMDDPSLDRGAHLQALVGLSRIYAVSRTGGAIWPHVRTAAQGTGRSLRVLDLATGGGDWPLDLVTRATKLGISLEVAGCDFSRRAVAFARLRALRANAKVRFFRLNICEDPLPEGYDVITCGLFLHHLSDDQAIAFLNKVSGAASQMVLVDDLCRSRLGLGLAWLATRTLSCSSVVHQDGPMSVRAAFSPEEMYNLAMTAGLSDVRIIRHWPERQLLVWHRS
ncbi:MAG: methyltransferase domain-containing protein [Planctomycetota bacterium]